MANTINNIEDDLNNVAKSPGGGGSLSVQGPDTVLVNRLTHANYVRPKAWTHSRDIDDVTKHSSELIRCGKCLADKFEDSFLLIEGQKGGDVRR